MKIKDIIRILEEQSPLKYAEDWDNVGLLVGDREKTVKKNNDFIRCNGCSNLTSSK